MAEQVSFFSVKSKIANYIKINLKNKIMIAQTVGCPVVRFTPYSAKVVLVRCDLENLEEFK